MLAGLAFGTASGADDDAALMALGKTLFTVGAVPPCALCHALKDAGATGAIGPAFDDLQPDAGSGHRRAQERHRRDAVVSRQPQRRADARARALRLQGERRRAIGAAIGRCGPFGGVAPRRTLAVLPLPPLVSGVR